MPIRCSVTPPVLVLLGLVAGACGGEPEDRWRCFAATYIDTNEPFCICADYLHPNTMLGGFAQLGSEAAECNDSQVTDPSGLTDRVCCAGQFSCECNHITCIETPDYCSCGEGYGLGDEVIDVVDVCEPPADGHCCVTHSASPASCFCSENECGNPGDEVPSCTTENVGCGYEQAVGDCRHPDGDEPTGGPASGPFEGCAGFRQTGECSADGPREPCSDHACTDEIPADVSGYCDCGQGRVDLDCGHPVGSCEAMCGAFSDSESCVAWRHTGDYRADGPRQPENDRACNSWIATDWSGFCECNGVDVPFDSYHAPFSCGTVCAGIPVDPANCEPASSGGGEGGGCSGNSDCGDCERCELSTGNCVAKLSC